MGPAPPKSWKEDKKEEEKPVVIIKEEVKEKKEQEKPVETKAPIPAVAKPVDKTLIASSLKNETIEKVSAEDIGAAFAYEMWLKKQAAGEVIVTD